MFEKWERELGIRAFTTLPCYCCQQLEFRETYHQSPFSFMRISNKQILCLWKMIQLFDQLPLVFILIFLQIWIRWWTIISRVRCWMKIMGNVAPWTRNVAPTKLQKIHTLHELWCDGLVVEYSPLEHHWLCGWAPTLSRGRWFESGLIYLFNLQMNY